MGVAAATLALRREQGVQTERKTDGGRTSRRRGASGDRLFSVKCAEGLAPKPSREGSRPNGRDPY